MRSGFTRPRVPRPQSSLGSWARLPNKAPTKTSRGQLGPQGSIGMYFGLFGSLILGPENFKEPQGGTGSTEGLCVQHRAGGNFGSNHEWLVLAAGVGHKATQKIQVVTK